MVQSIGIGHALEPRVAAHGTMAPSAHSGANAVTAPVVKISTWVPQSESALAFTLAAESTESATVRFVADRLTEPFVSASGGGHIWGTRITYVTLDFANRCIIRKCAREAFVRGALAFEALLLSAVSNVPLSALFAPIPESATVLSCAMSFQMQELNLGSW